MVRMAVEPLVKGGEMMVTIDVASLALMFASLVLSFVMVVIMLINVKK